MTTDTSNTQIKNDGRLLHAHLTKSKFQNLGFKEAAKLMGSVEAFRISLDRFRSRLMIRAAKNEGKQKEFRDAIANKIDRLNKQCEIKEQQIASIKKDKLPDVQNDIATVKGEIRDLKEHPEKYIDKARDNFNYYTLIALMTGLMLYLVLFYSSVLYSAFFREIKADKLTIYNSVFYTKVFEEASQSFVMLGLVLSGSLIFMALGYIMHQLFRKWELLGWKNKAVVLIATFIVDFIPAFKIAKNIHDANALNSFDRIPPFTLADAAADINFWQVIVYGYVIYIVFGVILFYFEKERDLKLALERLLKAKEDKLNSLIEKEDALKGEIQSIENEITTIKTEIAGLHRPSSIIIYNPNELKKILCDYTLGWIQFLKQGQYNQQDIDAISSILQKYISNRNDEDYEDYEAKKLSLSDLPF